MTNGDVIRSMTNEELAVLLSCDLYDHIRDNNRDHSCGITFALVCALRLKWLKEEVEKGAI